MNPTLQKLEDMLKLINEGLTKDDFVKSFEIVINMIKTMQNANAKEIAVMHENIRLMSEKMASDTSMDMEAMKKDCQAMCDKMMAMCEAKMQAMDDKMDSMQDGEDGAPGTNGQDGKPGQDADEEAIYQRLLADMKIEMKKIPERPTTSFFGGARKTRIIVLDLSSQLDGAKTTFFVGTHFGIIGVFSSSTPFPLRPVIDYNAVGKNIVFNVDPSITLAAGQNLIVQFMQ